MPDDNQLGSGPIEEKYRTLMQETAQYLDYLFNGETKGDKRQTGFVLLVFPFGDANGARCNYISNGADRKDIVKLLREQANRFDVNTQ